jgi:predicted porin
VIRRSRKQSAALAAALAFGCAASFAGNAAADVTLLEKDGWTVYTNGRIQAFLNYNDGNGFPVDVFDANGGPVDLQGGGIERADAYVELPENADSDDPGKVQELRIRTGFAGNLFGFGVKKQLRGDTTLDGYFGLGSVIQSAARRSYTKNYPDLREAFARLSSPSWGSFTFGRQGTLFSRGATEITYLYAYAYALGFPGAVTEAGDPYPTAGHVGFGVMGNPTNAGLAYSTPSLGGLQVTLGLFDANNVPVTNWERVRWPRLEGELAFQTNLGANGMFKLFANGAMQKLYQRDGDKDTTMLGTGYGARFEVGPVHLGVAGHYAKGSGLSFAFQPSPAIANPSDTEHELRTFDGYYGQLMVSATSQVDVSAGAGISRAKRGKADLENQIDDDNDPSTPAASDGGSPTGRDSVGHVPIKQQLGFSAGVTFHAADNLHFAIDYFRAMFEWYPPVPSIEGEGGPEQKFHFINAGATFDW